ncbi:SPOR domain-containing protein [Ahrensia marina]|uniref:SPOR domain-containing protein n=1 Tax=Ahrensia marina TaxID=1514904 RepID=A0A0M9GMQ5_9HYPH|nr:SPOR domain-containing protein [Ahrensia marina]KPB01507.1 hypothetical protein SU32_07965 [Ahrensia marina]
MTDAATRSVSQDETNEADIRSDDPLFELSRIMGIDDEQPQPDSAQIDPQIDLEDALLAELSVEHYEDNAEEAQVEESPEAAHEPVAPEPVEAAHAAPTAMSLEDELTAMLGGDVSVGTELPDYAEQVSEELAATSEKPVLATHEFENATPDVNYSENMDDELEAVQLHTAIQPEEPAIYENRAENVEPSGEVADQYPEEEVPSQDYAAPESAALMEDNALEDEFSAFFEDDLAVSDSSAEAAADQQPEQTEEDYEQPLPLSSSVDQDIEQFDNEIKNIFSEQADEPVEASASTGMPVLETTDMSAFNDNGPVAIDVPDLPDVDAEFSDNFEDELNIDFDEVSLEDDDSWSGAAAPVAATAATTAAATATSALSRRAGETAMANDDEAFDETRFEAELARDIEFVSHDISSSGDANVSLSEDNEGYNNEAVGGAGYDQPRTVKRGLVVAAILGCVAIVGAIGIFALSGGGAGTSDGPVLVKASSEPVKVAPENPGGKEVPNQDRAVFSESAGVPAQEELVSTSEEPVDIAAVPENALPSSLNGEDLQKGEDRLAPSATDSSSNEAAPFVVAPRKVRTLVVRPDGTLVEREAVPTPEPIEPQSTSAAEEVASVEPEQLGGVPVAETVNVESSETASEPVATAAATSDETSAPEASEATPALPTRTVQTKTISPTQIAERPKDQPVNIVNQEQTQVASAPAPTVATEAPSTPFSVQMASLPSEADAQQSARALTNRFGNVLGGRSLVIRRAEIEGKGTYYRVRVGADSRAEANTLCGQIKSAGGSCFVTR